MTDNESWRFKNRALSHLQREVGRAKALAVGALGWKRSDKTGAMFNVDPGQDWMPFSICSHQNDEGVHALTTLQGCSPAFLKRCGKTLEK